MQLCRLLQRYFLFVIEAKLINSEIFPRNNPYFMHRQVPHFSQIHVHLERVKVAYIIAFLFIEVEDVIGAVEDVDGVGLDLFGDGWLGIEILEACAFYECAFYLDGEVCSIDYF